MRISTESQPQFEQELNKYKGTQWHKTVEGSGIKASKDISGLRRVALLCGYALARFFTLGRNEEILSDYRSVKAGKRIVYITCAKLTDASISIIYAQIFNPKDLKQTKEDQTNTNPINAQDKTNKEEEDPASKVKSTSAQGGLVKDEAKPEVLTQPKTPPAAGPTPLQPDPALKPVLPPPPKLTTPPKQEPAPAKQNEAPPAQPNPIALTKQEPVLTKPAEVPPAPQSPVQPKVTPPQPQPKLEVPAPTAPPPQPTAVPAAPQPFVLPKAAPVKAEEIRYKPVDPARQKQLKVFVQGSEVAFYLNRRGFPNPSAANCPFNSLAVVAAHTGLTISVVIHKENQPLFNDLHAKDPVDFKAIVQKKIDELTPQIRTIESDIEKTKEQEKLQFETIKTTISTQITRLTEEDNRLSKEIAQLRKSQQEEASEKQKIKKELKTLKAKQKKPEGLSEEEGNQLGIKINKLEIEAVTPGKSDKPLVDKLKREATVQQQLVAKKHELENAKYSHSRDTEKMSALKAELKALQSSREDFTSALKKQNDLERSSQVLAILRGEAEGELNEEDAKALCRMIELEYGLRPTENAIAHKLPFYKGSSAAEQDHNRQQFWEALQSPNWRALRIGGGIHWWVYVRNPDGTVDEINDYTTTKMNTMTMDQLFNRFKEPGAWIDKQITFYDNNPNNLYSFKE